MGIAKDRNRQVPSRTLGLSCRAKGLDQVGTSRQNRTRSRVMDTKGISSMMPRRSWII